MTIKKKKKHDKILMLAKRKLNSIDSLISQALNDMEISHEEFITILNEKDKYERMKYNLINKNEDEKQEIKFKQYIKNFLIYIKMFEITRKNCYKCDLETTIDNNSQYFWINLKDYEAETEGKWLNMFNKHGNTLSIEEN